MLVSRSYAPCHSNRYYLNVEDVATGDLKGCMLLSGAKLSNTKTSRKGKFAFRLEGNGSSATHRAARRWYKWAVAAAAAMPREARRPRPRRPCPCRRLCVQPPTQASASEDSSFLPHFD